MKKIMKTIALVLCIIMAVGCYAYADEVQLISAGVKDYEGHWAQTVIEKWLNAGKVSGYPDGSYKPDNNVTRAEFVKMVNGIINFNKKGLVTYKDVPTTEWYYDNIGIAQEIGYISGYSADKFGPNDFITREQAASILARIQYLDNNATGVEKFTDKNNISSWAVEAVGAASEASFISGYIDGSLKPLKNLTRAEALTMIDNVMVNAKNYVIYNDGTELKETIINGDLIIAKTVGEGDVYLTNMSINGTIKVYGGGENSLYFNNVKVSKIVIDKDKVRLVLGEGTIVQEVEVSSETVLENTDGTVSKVTVTGENTVTLTGSFEEVTVTGSSNIVLDDAEITTLVVEQPIVIQGTGTISTLEANVNGIEFEAEVTIDETNLGDGVTEEPAPVEEPIVGGGGGGGGLPPTEPTYKISVSAVIDGTTYSPLFTTSTYTGTTNISTFLRDEVVKILNTGNVNIEGYFTKFNTKISNLSINGVQLNTEEGLAKIQEELTGTSIVNGFTAGIFSDSEISELEMKTILNAYNLTDLDKFNLIDLNKTVQYGQDEVIPTFKINNNSTDREGMRTFIINAGKLSINNFFAQYGTTVKIETVSGAKTATITITKVE